MSESPYIFDVSSQEFTQKVIEKSKETPVIVDFWASWCNPCKILMPILAKLAEEYQGAFILAKVDTDRQQELAAQQGVRSLPTVRAYKFGVPVDEFMGAMPEGDVRSFIDSNLITELDKTYQTAAQSLKSGDVDTAEDMFSKLYETESSNKQAAIGMALVHIARQRFEQAKDLLTHLPINFLEDEDVQALLSRIEFGAAITGAPSKSQLEAKAENSEQRYQLGAYYVLDGDYENALASFLAVLQTDKNYKEGAARTAMVSIFKILGNGGPIVNRYRAKMASLLH
ncbi:MAG: thioredoxin [Gammaproteobacteria bacterium]|nr:thioredoxin [Gammaproteobacteria bacterium]